MGDVAMTVPVIKSLSEKYTDAEIFMLTNKLFNPFFKNINNFKLINPDLKGKHKGIIGLFKLYKKIQKEIKPDIVIDLHDVLRSKILRSFFKYSGKKVYRINKGRSEKELLTKNNNKQLVQLKHTSQRYVDVFNNAGFDFEINHNALYVSKLPLPLNFSFSNAKTKRIGIAPFAMHKQKEYPLNKMIELIDILDKRNYEIFIFGGGTKEKKQAKNIENKFNNATSLIGKYKLEEEIAIISNLDLMISMDSSNMHIAALTGIKIISIWGATHPFAGFTPIVKKENLIIVQNENLSCRPCSVYGNKKCYKENLECFETISVNQILENI